MHQIEFFQSSSLFKNSFAVYQLNCALKIAPACVKVKILKAENLLHLGRANVRRIHFFLDKLIN